MTHEPRLAPAAAAELRSTRSGLWGSNLAPAEAKKKQDGVEQQPP